MKYDPETKILTMSQTDLEHCGFGWADFEGELFLRGGMEFTEREAAKKCHTIVVSMHEGLYPNECHRGA